MIMSRDESRLKTKSSVLMLSYFITLQGCRWHTTNLAFRREYKNRTMLFYGSDSIRQKMRGEKSSST